MRERQVRIHPQVTVLDRRVESGGKRREQPRPRHDIGTQRQMQRGPFDRGQMMPVRSQQVQQFGIREPMARQGEQRDHRFDQGGRSRVVFALQTFEYADEQRGERVAGRQFFDQRREVFNPARARPHFLENGLEELRVTPPLAGCNDVELRSVEFLAVVVPEIRAGEFAPGGNVQRRQFQRGLAAGQELVEHWSCRRGDHQSDAPG